MVVCVISTSRTADGSMYASPIQIFLTWEKCAASCMEYNTTAAYAMCVFCSDTEFMLVNYVWQSIIKHLCCP